jgi:AmmeMemoRadiSam system protein A
MLPLADSAKRTLLDVARRAVILAVESRELLEDLPDNEVLSQPGSAFVTLHRTGRLRGCVGQLASKEPLVSVIAYCAMAAALDDPRFAPMTPPELEGLAIEISVLSPLVDITSDQIEAGKHGLMVTRGEKRGVLLPQVAEQFNWTAERFLQETCLKADLDRDDWKQPGTRVQGFTAEIFSEAGFRADPRGDGRDVRAKSNYSTSM